MYKSVLVATFALLQMNSLAKGQLAYEVDVAKAAKDKALYGLAFLNLTRTSILDCFSHCLKHCVCMAFQMWQDTECQLLSNSTQHLTPKSLRRKVGCTYHNLQPKDEKESNQAGRCFSGVNCCRTSQPCFNGGSCVPSSDPYYTARFVCKCPDEYGGRRCEKCARGYAGERCQDCASGFTGNRCRECKAGFAGEHCKPVRSCRGYNNGILVAGIKNNRSLASGIYTIVDGNMKPFQVYCDFDRNASMAWTLIQSYQLWISITFKWSFVWDRPFQEHTPSWAAYRLSKSRMESIQRDSSKWRMTCDYQSSGTIYKDYVLTSNDKVDILTFNGDRCVQVEYIDIRGVNCSDCTAYMTQSHNRTYYSYIVSLHFDSYHSSNKPCDHKPVQGLKCDGRGEDNFGLYDCVNPEHRCTATQNSTSQTWFGGELIL